jgi:hypothetical protein
LSVDFGAVGGVGFAERGGDVTELLDDCGDLFPGQGLCGFWSCVELFLDLAAFVLDFPRWSGGMFVLVEDATEAVASVDVQVGDPIRVGDRFG